MCKRWMIKLMPKYTLKKFYESIFHKKISKHYDESFAEIFMSTFSGPVRSSRLVLAELPAALWLTCQWVNQCGWNGKNLPPPVFASISSGFWFFWVEKNMEIGRKKKHPDSYSWSQSWNQLLRMLEIHHPTFNGTVADFFWMFSFQTDSTGEFPLGRYIYIYTYICTIYIYIHIYMLFCFTCLLSIHLMTKSPQTVLDCLVYLPVHLR